MEKEDVNLAICGHAWHGKSTLVGKTVAELGLVGRRKLEQAEQLARQGRDASLVFAQLVFRQKDSTEEGSEANRGITVVPSFVRLEFERHRVMVIDTPGQEDYTNNRFAGMFSADCAVLVVDIDDRVAVVTEQVLRILQGYKIPLVGVVIAKIDKVHYSEDVFRRAVDDVKFALEMYELPMDVPFIPTSAYATGRSIYEPGDGITQVTERMSWYKGPTFHKLLSTLELPKIQPQKELRIVIHSADVHDQVPGIGTAVTGLIESGSVTRDTTLLFQPISAERGEPVTAEVRSLELTKGHVATPGIAITEAHPRQLVGIALRNVSVKDFRDLVKGRGTVAGTVQDPPSVARKFEALITVFDPSVVLKTGQQMILHIHADKVPVTVAEIVDVEPSPAQREALQRHRAPHEPAPREDADAFAALGATAVLAHPPVVVGEPHSLRAGAWARITFDAQRPVAVEPASRVRSLSKIVVRTTAKPIGYGHCVRIIE